MVRMGRTLVDGPWRRIRETLSAFRVSGIYEMVMRIVPCVVGVQVMVNGAPAVISSPSSGWPMGLPDGSLPEGVNWAEVRAISAASTLVVV